MAYTLSADEVAAFVDDGLVTPRYQLSDSLYERAKAAVDEMIDGLAPVDSEFALVAHLPPRPGVAGGSPGGEKVFRVAIDPEILDLVEAVLGPDLILWGSSLFAKPAGVGKRVQWHQDSNWWPMKPMVTATVWIAIDAASPDNGCLRYIPGSHRWPVLPHADQTEDGLPRRLHRAIGAGRRTATRHRVEAGALLDPSSQPGARVRTQPVLAATGWSGPSLHARDRPV